MRWYGSLFLLCISVGGSLYAQSPDTMYFGATDIRYMVFKRDRNGAATGPVSYYDSAHVLRLKFDVKEGSSDGVWRYYYPSGRSWAEVPVKNGRLHGVVRSYHPNGIIHATKPYKKGRLHGERILRDTLGVLVSGVHTELSPMDSVRIEYICVNGRPHGRIVMRRGDKKLLEGNCINGSAEGSFLIYDGQGNMVRRDYYHNGKFERSEQHGQLIINE